MPEAPHDHGASEELCFGMTAWTTNTSVCEFRMARLGDRSFANASHSRFCDTAEPCAQAFRMNRALPITNISETDPSKLHLLKQFVIALPSLMTFASRSKVQETRWLASFTGPDVTG